ncbi:DUF1501 domain-containing protein [Verticiella sediminum]|uniref:DUF1501 domain-containing protein n=1 Tax=Verticiella sediminum TaxID=1247510 RepID=A0A556B0K4_9BURK|nr:DUF1501 domain-containing protein [Verticiella sediminum]TSH98674.1 DUF1501 domain-containing protein [Verticiella sediminum]
MNRRDTLKALAALPLLHGTRLYAAPEAGSRLLLVFMRGGYDAASLLVPTNNAFYAESRPNIGIGSPGSGEGAARPLDADWGLHPALADSLLPLYERKQIAFIPFAGTEDLSRSHFETQNSIELGQSLEGSRDYRSGFLNRLATVLGGERAQAGAFTRQLPLVLRGKLEVPNIALTSPRQAAADERQRSLIEGMYAGTPLAGAVGESYLLRADARAALEKEMQEADAGAISAAGLEGETRRIATLMRDRFHLGFVDVGGWDTHVNQGNAQGVLANRLGTLGRALAGFAEGMGPRWKDTVVVVISEFGRTFCENGNKGTDHGHGTVYWVLGGGIDGGRIAGEQVRVAHETLHQDRDYPLLNEYRSVLGGLFGRMYGLDAKRLGTVFGDAPPQELRLV